MSPLRRWSALAVLALPVLLISVDMTVLGFALPAITTDLRPSATQVLWIVDVYSFLLAGLLVLMGNLGDRIGRRRLLLIGAVAFAVASCLTAFAPSAETLILGRALLGIGGATLMPSTLALLRSVFTDPHERRTAIGIWAAAFSGGAAIGPVVGGLLLEHFWWGSVFLINTPLMVLLVIGALLLVPESRNPLPGTFDITSAALSISGILPVVYALKSAAKGDFRLSTGLALVVGAVLLIAFVRRQRRVAEPLLDLRLLRQRAFTAAVLTNLLSVFALLGIMFFLPQYLMSVRGIRPLVAGLWLLPLAGATIVGSLIAARLARHLAPRWIIASGMVVAAVGMVIGTNLSAGGPLLVLAAASVLIGAGTGVAHTLTNDVILSTAPPERAGAAASISETAYEFGGAMGTAVLGAAGLVVYASRLRDVEGVPESSLEAARETIGGAVDIATPLPSDIAARLMAEAGDAFVAGMDVVLLAAAAVTLCTAVQAAVLLRPRPDRQEAVDPVGVRVDG